MWKRSFVATTVAVGGTVDDALAALAGPAPGEPSRARSETHGGDLGGHVAELVAGLRAPHRAARAAALAAAVRDIVFAVDQATLR
jgi:hypothetical protein